MGKVNRAKNNWKAQLWQEILVKVQRWSQQRLERLLQEETFHDSQRAASSRASLPIIWQHPETVPTDSHKASPEASAPLGWLEIASPGPPAHWVEKVRAGAPEWLPEALPEPFSEQLPEGLSEQLLSELLPLDGQLGNTFQFDPQSGQELSPESGLSYFSAAFLRQPFEQSSKQSSKQPSKRPCQRELSFGFSLLGGFLSQATQASSQASSQAVDWAGSQSSVLPVAESPASQLGLPSPQPIPAAAPPVLQFGFPQASRLAFKSASRSVFQSAPLQAHFNEVPEKKIDQVRPDQPFLFTENASVAGNSGGDKEKSRQLISKAGISKVGISKVGSPSREWRRVSLSTRETFRQDLRPLPTVSSFPSDQPSNNSPDHSQLRQVITQLKGTAGIPQVSRTDLWPALPEARDESPDSHWNQSFARWQHLRRLEQEQQGKSWNEWRF